MRALYYMGAAVVLGGLYLSAACYVPASDRVRDRETAMLLPATSSAVELQPEFEVDESYEPPSDPIRINEVTVEELANRGIRGLGWKTAERIIEHREEKGLFQSMDDLDRAPGVGERMLAAFYDVGVDFRPPDTTVPRPVKPRFRPPGGVPLEIAAGRRPYFTKEHAVVLPESMFRAIEASFPRFRTWEKAANDAEAYPEYFRFDENQIPRGVIGDFNGDRRPDLVLDGFNDTFIATLVLLSSDTGYFISQWWAITIRGPGNFQPPSGEELYQLVPPGRRECPYGIDDGDTAELILSHDAYESIYLEKASAINFFEDGRWKACGTSD